MLVVYWVKLQIAFTATSSMQQLLRSNRHSAVTWYRKQKHEMWIECGGEAVTITHQAIAWEITKEVTEGKNYQKKGPPLTIHCCVRAKNSNKCIYTFTPSSENGTNWPWTKVIHVLFGSVDEEHQQLLRRIMVCNVSQECVVSLWSALSLKDESLLRLETWFVKLSVPSILA